MLNRGEQRWELRGPDGEPTGYVTLEFVRRAGTALLEAALARRGWPRLTPRLAWWECVLIGGPAHGRHVYLDPASNAIPPPALYAAPEVELPVGPGIPLQTVIPPPVAYRRGAQACGHGRACPYPYFAS